MIFDDRRHAGIVLAERLAVLTLNRPLVLALPRGGIPVGFEVARHLGADLDVLVARKVAAPHDPDLAVAALAEGCERAVADRDLLSLALVDRAQLIRLCEAARDEMALKVRRYRNGRPLPSLAGRDVVLVDDGLATGLTAHAALVALRGRPLGRLVLAAPVSDRETATRLRAHVDEVIVAHPVASLSAIGQWYRSFTPVSDDEVLDLLSQAQRPASVA